MAKKKQPQPHRQQRDEALTLKDALSPSVLEQLKKAQHNLKAEEVRKQEEEVESRRREKREREKNKSFEELLEESSMDWKNYK